VKCRYPTFVDAVRDIDDALCMIFLFANLPATSRVSTTLIDNCTRLAAEWQLYTLHSHSLRKVFLSIKGVYYQTEVMGQNVTWLVPYQFTQNVSVHQVSQQNPEVGTDPPDVDVRVMLTFLELYQTLLGFVFFKLYTDAGLVYPPPLDTKKEETAAGVGAFSLQQITEQRVQDVKNPPELKVSARDVRQTIKTIYSQGQGDDPAGNYVEEENVTPEEDFVPQPSKSTPEETAVLSTFQSLSAQEGSAVTKLFAPYTFWLSRETSRPIFEFVVRSCGGRIGWPASSGSGSPIDESDESITHVIIDRPPVERPNETEEERRRRLQRKYIQPQWVIDCINGGKIVLEDMYAQGKPLPPHLSPFGDHEGAYDPTAASPGDDVEMIEKESDEEEDADAEAEPRLAVLDVDVTEDPDALRAAELAAEAAGIDYGAFEREVEKTKKAKGKSAPVPADTEEDMNKMLMSNKKRKLYEKMKYGQRKKETEVGSSADLRLLSSDD
jgi:pescadillo protein